ncbi:hypothetical protein PQX77_004900 [Marasmius sp. AFHP31]|nr:hypothetical protein PQX77_004900 [Marasmius sp. AFHP31]
MATSVVIAIICIVVAVLGVAAGVFIFLRRRNARRRKAPYKSGNLLEFVGRNGTSQGATPDEMKGLDPENQYAQINVQSYDSDSSTPTEQRPTSLQFALIPPTPDPSQAHFTKETAAHDVPLSNPHESPAEHSPSLHNPHHDLSPSQASSESRLTNPFDDASEESSLLSNPHSDTESQSHSHSNLTRFESTGPTTATTTQNSLRPSPQQLPKLVIPPLRNTASSHKTAPSKPVVHHKSTTFSVQSHKPEVGMVPTQGSPIPSPDSYTPSAYSQASAGTQLGNLLFELGDEPAPPVPPLPSHITPAPISLPFTMPIPDLPPVPPSPRPEPEEESELQRVPTAVVSHLLKSRGANRNRMPTIGLGGGGEASAEMVEHIERSGSIVSYRGGGTKKYKESREKRKFKKMHSVKEYEDDAHDENSEDEFDNGVMENEDDLEEKAALNQRVLAYYESDRIEEVQPLRLNRNKQY